MRPSCRPASPGRRPSWSSVISRSLPAKYFNIYWNILIFTGIFKIFYLVLSNILVLADVQYLRLVVVQLGVAHDNVGVGVDLSISVAV